ncbi:MAG TPA: hypothetical protein PLG15_07015, partial [Candidatus Gastranaerophilaceae bacterium]|nr:hypothetical protein [Candidatus Gastranaerophilaceae bacterium]
MEIRPRKVQTNVIFHDVDHGINKNYNMPVGSKIDVNGLTYNVKENGTYYKGKRVNQINIHEDERLCLSTFNSTQDSVIDRNDTRVFVNGRHRNYVDDANRRLNEEGADCRIKKTQDEDGSVIDGSCDENG